MVPLNLTYLHCLQHSFFKHLVNLYLQQAISTQQDFSAGDQMAMRSFMLNSAVNPYIIGLFNSKFRAYVMGVMGRCFRKWHLHYFAS